MMTRGVDGFVYIQFDFQFHLTGEIAHASRAVPRSTSHHQSTYLAQSTIHHTTDPPPPPFFFEPDPDPPSTLALLTTTVPSASLHSETLTAVPPISLLQWPSPRVPQHVGFWFWREFAVRAGETGEITGGVGCSGGGEVWVWREWRVE